ncbi:hypothetical protein AAFF_G00129720 [Aldrovandia affinis]|uniref:BTB domain-containing protein n=1 Tax=Aldrovandia affinis TaxID=143900 RepID=A0AAD7WAD5_9TELE|nr:hypothetical protein AAFF_G00129720 [Aldrovandia affinis]
MSIRIQGMGHGANLLTELNRCRPSNSLCNEVLWVGGHSFPAHRVVLACVASYFQGLFSSGRGAGTFNLDFMAPANFEKPPKAEDTGLLSEYGWTAQGKRPGESPVDGGSPRAGEPLLHPPLRLKTEERQHGREKDGLGHRLLHCSAQPDPGTSSSGDPLEGLQMGPAEERLGIEEGDVLLEEDEADEEGGRPVLEEEEPGPQGNGGVEEQFHLSHDASNLHGWPGKRKADHALEYSCPLPGETDGAARPGTSGAQGR